MGYLCSAEQQINVLDMDQQNTHFLKHLENKVKPLAGKKKLRKGRFYYLQGDMEAKLDPCSKKTWALNMKSQVFLSSMHLLPMSVRTWGNLVMTTREIILL